MATINKDIKLIATAETGGAESKFATLDRTIENTTKSMGGLSRSTNQGNMMLMSTSRIVQDMPFGFMAVGNNITFLAEQFAYAKTQGMGFKDSLKSMFTSLMGTGGIIFAISTAVTVLTYLSMQSRKSADEVEKLEDKFKRLRTSAKDLKDEISTLTGKIEDLSNPSVLENSIMWMGVMTGLTPNAIKDRIEDIKKLRQELGYTNAITEEQNNIANIAENMRGKTKAQILDLTSAYQLNSEQIKSITNYLEQQQAKFPVVSQGYKQIESTIDSLRSIFQKTNKEMGTNSDWFDKLKNKYKEGLNSNIDLKHLPFGRTPTNPFQKYFTGMQNVQRPGLGFSDSEIRQQFLKENEFLITNVISSLGVLRGEFSNFWQSVFGEANSLLEKLLMNFGENLLELGTKRLAGGLLDFIVPGLGTAFGALSGRSQTIQNNIIIDNQTVAVMYTTGKNYAQRLRKD